MFIIQSRSLMLGIYATINRFDKTVQFEQYDLSYIAYNAYTLREIVRNRSDGTIHGADAHVSAMASTDDVLVVVGLIFALKEKK